MNYARQHEMAEHYQPLQPPRSGGSKVMLAAVLLFAIAGALAFYAFQLWTEQRSTRAALKTAKGEIVTLRQTSGDRARAVAALEQQRSDRDLLLKQANDKLL